MSDQTTSTIMMIRPVAFTFNVQTATDNHYQKQLQGLRPEEAQEKALNEFEAMATLLSDAGVNVLTFDDTPEPHTPDSIFPNNWISFHGNGRVVIYPMHAENRRAEIRHDLLDSLREKGFRITEVLDYASSVDENCFLEGTGSLVLDRENRIAYASRSERTDRILLDDWAEQMGYDVVSFDATQQVNGELQPIYHTNVMMSVGHALAVIGADSIRNVEERQQVLGRLASTGKEVILLSETQTANFAGNMLEVMNSEGEHIMVMSSQAHAVLTEPQRKQIKKFARILHSPLDTIEALGGGSARCMMAEVFLPVA